MARGGGGGEKNFIYIFSAYICCSTATPIVRIQFRSSIRFVLTCFFFWSCRSIDNSIRKFFFHLYSSFPNRWFCRERWMEIFSDREIVCVYCVCATQKNSLCFATISENGKEENAKKILCKKEHIQEEPSSCVCLTLAHSMAFCVCEWRMQKKLGQWFVCQRHSLTCGCFFSCFSFLFIFSVFSIERKTEQKIK